MKHVAIITLNWNGRDDTLALLKSLKALHARDIKISTIVVDNGSTDDSVPSIKSKFPSVSVLENHTNLGFAAGNNVAMYRALKQDADFVWLINNDTTVDARALEALLHGFSDRKVGIAGSKIYFFPGREFHKDRYTGSEKGKVLWYAGGLIDWDNMYASHRGVDDVDQGQYDQTVQTAFVTGCSMMVKREVFEKIGYLDEKFFAYLEDLDFCLRAKAAGYFLLYVPSSLVWHKNAGSSGVGSTLHEYYMTRNRLLIGFRYAPYGTKFALCKEGLSFVLNGPTIRRKAILDALLYRWGKQSI